MDVCSRYTGGHNMYEKSNWKCSFWLSTLKKQAACFSEMFASSNMISLCHKPKDYNLKNTRDGKGLFYTVFLTSYFLYTNRYQINTYSARGSHAGHRSFYPETTSESRWITYIKVNVYKLLVI